MLRLTLADYASRWHEEDLGRLVRDSSAPLLVEIGARQDGAGKAAEERPAFRTGEIDLEMVKARHLRPDQRQVFFVQKRPGGVFPDVVSIGRTPNVDICLPRTGISKFHAHFNQPSPGRILLTDNGSRNGTFVNNQRLEANTPTEIDGGAEVRFASHAFRLLTPSEFTRLVEGLRELGRG